MVSDPTIALPPASVAHLYSNITGATADPSNPNRYIVPCSSNIQIIMAFKGTNFTLDPSDAITNENGTCFGTVEATNSAVIVVGSPLMRNVYTYVIRFQVSCYEAQHVDAVLLQRHSTRRLRPSPLDLLPGREVQGHTDAIIYTDSVI